MRVASSFLTTLLLSSIPCFVGACSSSGSNNAAPCGVEPQSGCADGLACELVEGGSTGCFAPVMVQGKVTSSADGKAVAGARVVARDVNGAFVARDVAVSALDGSYRLMVPATRKADGTPTLPSFTLRADASGFASFPSGLRIALPIDVSAPTKAADGSYVVQNAGTDVSVDPLASTSGLGTVSGSVRGAQGIAVSGTLVVAGASSGLAARDGTFTIFNVPAGAQTVRGYLQGSNFTPANATVVAGAELTGVVLASAGAAAATVSGSVQIVNPSAGSASSTSVVLVVKSTYVAAIARGEAPKGLRVAGVTGAFSIAGVSDGTYVVLAAFENDGLVRDPDTAIGGTATQEVTVAGASTAAGSFKVTGALDVRSPGASGPEAVSSTAPTFTWADDSSEDGYDLWVYDGFGNVIWSAPPLPSVSGSKDVTAMYAGPALKPGYYQFRAASFRSKTGKKTYISMTEDLKGVFIVK
jgi:hypothetical protein